MSNWGATGSTIELISFLFVLFAEIVFFCAMSVISDLSDTIPNKAIIWAGVTTSLLIYFVGTMLLAYIRNAYYSDTTKFVLHELILLAAISLIVLLICSVAAKINATEANERKNREYLQYIERKIFSLKVDNNNGKYLKQLDGIYETIKFSDKTAYCYLDNDIESEVDSLSELIKCETDDSSDEKITLSLQKIQELFKKRSMILAENSRGNC